MTAPVFADPAFARRWALRLALTWLALLYGRVVWVSRLENERAIAAETAGDVDAALAHHRRAARHVAPPFDRSGDSIARLFSLASRAEASGNDELALAALRSIRGSILAARGPFPLHGSELARADAAIATIVARLDQGPDFRDRDREDVAALHLRALAEEPHESPLGLLAAILGLITFVFASRRFLVDAVDVDERWDRPAAVRAALLGALGLALLTFGLVLT